MPAIVAIRNAEVEGRAAGYGSRSKNIRAYGLPVDGISGGVSSCNFEADGVVEVVGVAGEVEVRK